MNKKHYSICLLVFMLIVSYSDHFINSTGNNHNSFDTKQDYDWETLSLDESLGYLGQGFLRPDSKTDGFFFSDITNHFVGIFDSSGYPTKYIGRRGRGPGEFENPKSVARANNGTIYVAELNGRISAFDGETGAFLDMLLFDFTQIHEIINYKENYLIVSGKRKSQITDDWRFKHLHVIDLESKKIIHSFFSEPLFEDYLIPVVMTLHNSILSLEIIDDKIFVMHGLVTDLYVYDSKFNHIDTIPIDFPNHRSISNLSRKDATNLISALKGFTLINTLVSIDADHALIQLVDVNEINLTKGGQSDYTVRTYSFDLNAKELRDMTISKYLLFKNTENKVFFLKTPGSIEYHYIQF